MSPSPSTAWCSARRDYVDLANFGSFRGGKLHKTCNLHTKKRHVFDDYGPFLNAIEKWASEVCLLFTEYPCIV